MGAANISAPPDVLVLADAGPEAGLGHLARCSAIATALWTRGIGCTLIAAGAVEPPRTRLAWRPVADVGVLAGAAPALALLDTYRLDIGALRDHLRPARLAVMHDEGPVFGGADLVLTSDPGQSRVLPHVLGGSELSCLGPDYWGLPAARAARGSIAKVLVTTGGGDPGSQALPLVATVAAALPRAEVTLVRGPQAMFGEPPGVTVLDRPASLIDALRSADLAVSSAGSSLLEALAVGTPAVGILLANNQSGKASALAARGIVRVFAPSSFPALAVYLSELDGEPGARTQLSHRGQQEIDGYGALRVAARLDALLRRG